MTWGAIIGFVAGLVYVASNTHQGSALQLGESADVTEYVQTVRQRLMAHMNAEPPSFLPERPDTSARDDPRMETTGAGRPASTWALPATAIDLEQSDEDQEFADESTRPRQADGCQHEDHEGQPIGRHAVDQATIRLDVARMHAVIDDADNEE